MTRTIACLAPILAVALTAPGCGASHDSLLEDMADRMEAFADLLEECRQKSDVVERQAELQSLAEEIDELSEMARELDPPAAEEVDQLRESHEARLRASSKRIRKFAASDLGRDPEVERWVRLALRGESFGEKEN